MLSFTLIILLHEHGIVHHECLSFSLILARDSIDRTLVCVCGENTKCVKGVDSTLWLDHSLLVCVWADCDGNKKETYIIILSFPHVCFVSVMRFESQMTVKSDFGPKSGERSSGDIVHNMK